MGLLAYSVLVVGVISHQGLYYSKGDPTTLSNVAFLKLQDHKLSVTGLKKTHTLLLKGSFPV